MSIFRGVRARTLQVQSEAIPQHLGAPALEIWRIDGRELLNGLFEYVVYLRTPDALNVNAAGAADYNLDGFIGREISVTIELDGAGEFVPGVVGASTDRIGAGVREINGLITDAQLWGEEGRHIQYRLVVRPWLHLATLTTDCKIFQNKTVVEILDEVLRDYSFPVAKRLIETYPARDYQTQLNETDFAFFERLCQEWGINYFFEHSDGKHRLVLIDNMGAHKTMPSDAYSEVDYHPPNWKTDAEYIHAFVPHHRLTSGRYASRDYDYTRPKSELASGRRDPRPTGHADGEIYQWHADSAGSHYAQPRAGTTGANNPADEGDRLALLRMQQLRTHGARARASGNLRGMVPGCTFKLNKHPRRNANAEYLVLDTELRIEDVGQDSQRVDASRDRSQRWLVTVDFTAHPTTEALRPEHRRAKPLTGGPQPALVVGPAGQNIWTDELGRIKVQFPWDRIGGRNQHSTCWLRVSSPWAGNQLGAIQIPRVGQEVIVDFYGGDPDLPICTGRVHNQMNLPPWSLPDQSALSGFRSRELNEDGGNSAAGGSNHLVFDDTPQRIQTQLKSDHRHSQLSLGFLARIEDNKGRKDPRGEGFELRTDGHGVMRAADGMLITTEPRGRAARHAKDMDETVARLTAAREQLDHLCDSAQKAQAQEPGDQDDVAKAVHAQNDAIRGSGQLDARSGNFPELAEPHLVLASPAGIETSTPKSTHIASFEHNQLSSGAHTSIAAGKSFLVSAVRAVRLFASFVKIVAAKNDIDIVALEQNINVLAQLKIKTTADKISIIARQELELGAGGSLATYNSSGILSKTAGQWTVHAAVHSFMSGQSQGPEGKLPTTSFQGCNPSAKQAAATQSPTVALD